MNVGVILVRMNIDLVLATLNRQRVDYLLIGGVNFLLRHGPHLTFDIDFWIDDRADNLARCERALIELKAEWGEADGDWCPVSERKPGWLHRQTVFCLNSPAASIDIFRSVRGLADWQASRQRAIVGRTGGGVEYVGLCDEDMLQCQMALDPSQRRLMRVAALRVALRIDDEPN